MFREFRQAGLSSALRQGWGRGVQAVGPESSDPWKNPKGQVYSPQLLCPSCCLGQDQILSSERGLNRKWWFYPSRAGDRACGCQPPAYARAPAPQHSGPSLCHLTSLHRLALSHTTARLTFPRLPIPVPIPLLLLGHQPGMQKSNLFSPHLYASRPYRACESPMEALSLSGLPWKTSPLRGHVSPPYYFEGSLPEPSSALPAFCLLGQLDQRFPPGLAS